MLEKARENITFNKKGEALGAIIHTIHVISFWGFSIMVY
jgi:hypothetical protein